jgi:GDP-L-fucose synthase
MKMDLKPKRIVVTGGTGFLGTHLVDMLRKKGCQQIAVPGRHQFDLTRQEAVDRLFEEFHPEILIHAAASVGGIGANRANPGRFFFENAMMGIQVK